MQKILLTIIMLSFFFQPKKVETFKPLVVLELFTSQGCSSCPPADDLLNEVKSKYSDNQIVALSYHVDYWNYIGWKDPFSKKEFSNKQRAYGRKFNSSSIYTPQIVVNGKEHFVGSKKGVMKSKLDSYLKKTSLNRVVLSNIKKENGAISLDYKVEGAINKKTLRIALVINERITSIKRGENRNRTLKNANIVVEEVYLNLDSGNGKGSISIPDIVTQNDDLSIVALIQAENLDITGGGQIKL
ncbi:DUF1223 domain-containing protein [Flavivirga spongiicola]|uniref:DUF1223 domain-containing protein n=1 Tax=Flavivirga spongiicola TaxID=421621 RepID=A0ABU7XWZ5_9FLAO|nr:DUF1223 domain-containing protein [Flavivirga sp. MEBiC05379]MDO5980292.1 DUF1223 domain-containing protein [Flavivirga sp. MEBiC05379]